MKKQKKTSNHASRLQDRDLVSVRGGGISGSGSPLAIVGGGIAPDDNGVISSRD